ncbi:glyoxalase superfamily protein [Actinosynnema sp. NPDC050801]|uniref:glyoxalase superfamily protein n=1 Tax=unclassified Actinosynnema TaxID=2637065 RepID=UPI00340371A1
MDWKLEVVIVPVSDVDRAKAFYTDKLGFTLDTDHRAGDGDAFRVVQVTPPGSACSLVFGKGLGDSGAPGSLKGCQLVVSDIEAAHAHLEANGVGNSGPQHFENGAMAPGRDPAGADYNSFIFFDDPDGNTWSVQEVKRSA